MGLYTDAYTAQLTHKAILSTAPTSGRGGPISDGLLQNEQILMCFE